MDEYRLKVYQQLQKHNLLEDAGISPILPDKDGVSPLRNSAEGRPMDFKQLPVIAVFLLPVIPKSEEY